MGKTQKLFNSVKYILINIEEMKINVKCDFVVLSARMEHGVLKVPLKKIVGWVKKELEPILLSQEVEE